MTVAGSSNDNYQWQLPAIAANDSGSELHWQATPVVANVNGSQRQWQQVVDSDIAMAGSNSNGCHGIKVEVWLCFGFSTKTKRLCLSEEAFFIADDEDIQVT